MRAPSSAGLGRAAALFARQQRRGQTPGGVMVARHRGTIVPAEAVGLAGEIVRRVSGRPIDAFVAELLAPEIEGLRFRGAPGEASGVARNAWLGDPDYRLGGLRLADGFEATNNGFSCFEALVPGAGMLADAPSLTAFYDMLLRGGVLASGRRLLRAEVLRPYLARVTSGRDRVTGAWLTLGRGFAVGWALPHPFGWWGTGRCFGHAGGFAMLAFADPQADLSVAILTTANRGVSELVRRFAPLAQAIRRG